MTLTEFLLARIAEDEADARAILDFFYGDGEWSWNLHGLSTKVSLVDERGVEMVATKGDGPTWMVTAHIARHDPARVLAECHAKQWILGFVGTMQDEAGRHDSDPAFKLAFGMRASAGQAILQHLAQVYADHPDFDPAWRP